jgi:ribosome-associated protein
VDLLSDKQAIDTVMLDIHQVSLLADYFVISTGEVDRQIRAMADEVQKSLKADGVPASHIEGEPDSGWVLMDYGNVIVHLLSPRMRDFYRLEELWKDARVVVRIQ